MTEQPPTTPPQQPPYPPQQPPPYPPYGYYPPQPPYNTYAILSLALGLFVLPPLGIYFGYQARKQIAVTGERGAELATAGIVVGWVLTSIMAAFFVIWCGFMGIGLGMFGAVGAAA